MREISSFLSRLFNTEFMTKSVISYGECFSDIIYEKTQLTCNLHVTLIWFVKSTIFEPRCDKTGLRGFRLGQVQHKPGCTATEDC